MPRSTHTLGAALAALLAAAPAAAQQAPGLTLDQAVRHALEASPQIEIARARLDGGQGEVLSAAAPFDLQLGVKVQGAQSSQYALAQTGGLADQATVSHSTGYTVSATRQLRSGVTVQPSLGVTRTTVAGLAQADAASSVNLGVSVPLLRGLGGTALAAPERAARVGWQAYGEGLRHEMATGVLQAAGAYWDYVAAQARLEVTTGSEARAERLLDETRRLVQADERPAADLDALNAALASKRAARFAAEQGVAQARRALGLAMGLDAAGIAALPAPATPFPAAPAWAATPGDQERLVQLALARRADLAGAGLQVRAAEILDRGARSDLKPRLDLRVDVGYTGRQMGPAAAGQLVRPLFDHVPGLNAQLRVDWQLPLGNLDARGAVLQREALVRQQRAAQRDLQAQVASAVEVAAQALQRSAAQVAEAERAARLYGAAVEHEREKNRLGASTLFDVTYAEDSRTSAELALVSARVAYAQALAELRFATGTLLDPGTGALEPAALTARP